MTLFGRGPNLFCGGGAGGGGSGGGGKGSGLSAFFQNHTIKLKSLIAVKKLIQKN